MTPRHVTLVASELRGFTLTGGIATSATNLALALARWGHRVEVLYTGTPTTRALDSDWARILADAGVGIRLLPRSGEPTEPAYFAQMRDVALALRNTPSDVVIAEDLGAPAYVALRLRHLGLGFENTLFVVSVHGTRRWITDTARKVRVLPGAHAITGLEQDSLELADAAVSPSAYALEWMREQRWRLPERTVLIPHLSDAAAAGETGPSQHDARTGARVERIAFFGRLEERKGIAPFIGGLNALELKLLEGVDLVFLGKATPAWTPERVRAELSGQVTRSFRHISFETELDQPEALAQLARPGTLAVLPSFGETFGNAVRECLDNGIPFIASSAGATPELIAAEDLPRVLFEPTPEGIARALARALTSDDALRPARAAIDEVTSQAAWAEVLALDPIGHRRLPEEQPAVDVVVSARGRSHALERCLAALAGQRYRPARVLVVRERGAPAKLPSPDGLELVSIASDSGSVEALREAGLEAVRSPFVVFLEEDDVPAPELLETLVRAQQAAQADVVSCGFYSEAKDTPRTLRLFPGEPGGLGLVANGYGQVALLRPSALATLSFAWPVAGDPDWPLLARLSAAEARIVSVPEPLLTRAREPGRIERQPTDALLVAQELERVLPEQLRSVARLAAGLAADAATPEPEADGSLTHRVARRLRRS
jgi:glycosyltransferase involved in cell wall biosynthesis